MVPANTIVNIFDGELIVDRHQLNLPIYLVFDSLFANGLNVCQSTFRARLQEAAKEVRSRFTKGRIVSELDPVFKASQEGSGLPRIDIFMKDMFEVWDVEGIFRHLIPKL